MRNLHYAIKQIESTIRRVDADSVDLREGRRIICESLQDLGEIQRDSSLSLSDTIEAITRRRSGLTKRELGSVVVRLVCCPNILSKECLKKGRRHAVLLIEEGCGDLLGKLLKGKKVLTHQKLETATLIHRNACKGLEYLCHSFTNLQDLNARRQSIMKAISFGPTRSYLDVFGFAAVHSSVDSLLGLVANVVQTQGYELQANLQSLLESVRDNLTRYKKIPTFIVRDYMIPFLENLQTTAVGLQDSLAEEFTCEIATPVSPYELEKKYPLHVAGSQFSISVPLSNSGPGVAQDVRVECVSENCEIENDEIRLGDVTPGSFVLGVIVKVTEPQQQIGVVVEIQWGVVGDQSVHTRLLSVIAKGQRTDLDWDRLSTQQRYNLEVAYDKEKEFYGRKDAVERILRRLAPNLMQSCYITGQKRVGKSSLARAVENRLQSKRHPGDYRILYLECGEIRHSSGADTLNELGEQLEDFLVGSLPRSIDWTRKTYSSSLTPLNRLLNQLYAVRSKTRFVVMLDEFDEINESLYRQGELANTFFLNLRTLSSKRNMAFVLVGAERMPYVMASQGEKLNKFSRESLDSFNQTTEWEDYCALVRTPVENVFKVHESALRRLFELTNGHPYFTKLLCATVYEFAVEAKDAEVSSSEVERAAQRVVKSLDTNAFAHYWRDGIRGDSNEIEIVSLKRRRLFAAWARTARSRNPLTYESIRGNVRFGVDPNEVLSHLENACQRGVFREKDGIYRPSVDLFGVWLREGGFLRLISDRLGDELAEAKQRREDKAFVKADEIVRLADSWGLYQGRQITESRIRAWLDQVDSNVNQRMLFKVLQNIRFIDNLEVREMFSLAHSWILRHLPVFVKKTRSQRRGDILVSYADSLGKSGSHYAQIYVGANEIVSGNIVPPKKLGERLREFGADRRIGVVVVDDIIGTGTNLIERLSSLNDTFRKAGVGTDVPLSVVVLCGTIKEERRVRTQLGKLMANADLHICETLDNRHFAFGGSAGIWKTENERDAAKTLVTDLGVRVQRRKPLGFDDQGLLVTFSRNCPNNTLPILHGSGRGGKQWFPLFPRTKG